METIGILEREIADLRKTLAQKENELFEIKKKWMSKPQLDNQIQVNPNGLHGQSHVERLPRWAIERYSRQILVPDIGVDGQVALLAAKVLLVGAGGLGCPAAAYLAGAGVGEIGLVDYDTVDLTNVHRQLLHGETDQGTSKVQSAAAALRRINSKITVTTHETQLSSANALDIVGRYHMVLDCSDNVPTRYLLNDACCLTKLPLISGSALKMEGQLTVYGYRGPKDANEKEAYQGPCYRCLFPTPPPPETVGSCSANGVVGPVPGLIGVLQALEAIKLIVGFPHNKLLVERMLVFDGDDCTFRNVDAWTTLDDTTKNFHLLTSLVDNIPAKRRRLKHKGEISRKGDSKLYHLVYDDQKLPVCRTTFLNTLGVKEAMDPQLKILPPSQRISASELPNLLSPSHLLVDVRSTSEFNMCRIDGAVNYPVDSLRGHVLEKLLEEIRQTDGQVTFICRRGNDSQVVAKLVLDALPGAAGRIRDVVGGLHAWAKHVDQEFPVY
ncbi:adenylyltransferase and sulfurtransferase MOCS3 [Leguminivora glycinivorella]|uniref:adenylyltransferase and sulfurtransferase MOCS3 n=1 Tax=Leguminivora glycinivorella TaxID=1035111 RepID=UPI0020104E6A|nr:adenylyltransferase and sulfurtransferase MOCS3 [Leguminivora glycinivorella]